MMRDEMKKREVEMAMMMMMMERECPSQGA